MEQNKDKVLSLLSENPTESSRKIQSTVYRENEIANKIVKGRIRTQIQEQLISSKHRSGKTRALTFTGWLAAASVLFVVGTLFLLQSHFHTEKFEAVLTQDSISKFVSISESPLSIKSHFALSRGTLLNIVGDRLETESTLGKYPWQTFAISEGRFVVTYNRDHREPPIEFRCGAYTVRVTGTVLGIAYSTQELKVGVAEGEVHIINAKGAKTSVRAGFLWKTKLSDNAVPVISTISKSTFSLLFGITRNSRPAIRKPTNTFRIREIDAREAPPVSDKN